MALCHGCHLHVSSFPMDHVELWEKKFSKQRRDRINKLHNQTLIKKKDVATEENLKLLKLLLFKYIGVL
jgi:hypothetical protein